ncbi:hypothetical protein BLNAU_7164 [Blattamonas nauphoetae]|uniref:Cep57 centrosome microtubule-binding domain-containing protein n=1 Tax=Blattamonas nauphoetae TaxID=2049346 RepID=A0ABQ9Y2M1_9EUKA|nr:hypothetical protein BLNAU_7164 [Blattamonas nauphoetae]
MYSTGRSSHFSHDPIQQSENVVSAIHRMQNRIQQQEEEILQKSRDIEQLQQYLSSANDQIRFLEQKMSNIEKDADFQYQQAQQANRVICDLQLQIQASQDKIRMKDHDVETLKNDIVTYKQQNEQIPILNSRIASLELQLEEEQHFTQTIKSKYEKLSSAHNVLLKTNQSLLSSVVAGTSSQHLPSTSNKPTQRPKSSRDDLRSKEKRTTARGTVVESVNSHGVILVDPSADISRRANPSDSSSHHLKTTEHPRREYGKVVQAIPDDPPMPLKNQFGSRNRLGGEEHCDECGGVKKEWGEQKTDDLSDSDSFADSISELNERRLRSGKKKPQSSAKTRPRAKTARKPLNRSAVSVSHSVTERLYLSPLEKDKFPANPEQYSFTARAARRSFTNVVSSLASELDELLADQKRLQKKLRDSSNGKGEEHPAVIADQLDNVTQRIERKVEQIRSLDEYNTRVVEKEKPNKKTKK